MNNFHNSHSKMKHKDCSACIMRTLTFLHLTFFPIKSSCPHSDKKVKKCDFKICKRHLYISYATNIVVTLITYTYLKMLSTYCPENKNQCLIVLTRFLFALCGNLLVLFCLINVKIRVQWMQVLQYFIENCRKYGVPRILTRRQFLRLKMNRNFLLCLTYVFVSLVAVFNVFLTQDDLDYGYIRHVASVASMFFQFQIIFQISQQCKFTFYLFKSIRKSMKCVMLVHLHSISRNEQYERITRREPLLTDHLKKFNGYLLKIGYSFRSWSKFYKSVMVVMFLISTGILIINSYLIVVLRVGDFNKKILELDIKTFATIFGVIYLLHNGEQTSHLV